MIIGKLKQLERTKRTEKGKFIEKRVQEGNFGERDSCKRKVVIEHE